MVACRELRLKRPGLARGLEESLVPFPPFCVTVSFQDTGPQGARAHSQTRAPAHKPFPGAPLTPMLGLRVPVQLEVKKPHSAGLGLGGMGRFESSQLCLHIGAFALEVALGWAQQGVVGLRGTGKTGGSQSSASFI